MDETNWSFWTFIATAIYALVSLLQWRAISRQADLTGESIRITDRAVTAANRNATAAFQAADASGRSADIAHRALVSTQRAFFLQKGFSRNQVNRPDLSQPAWGFDLTIEFENVGVTPALELLMQSGCGWTDGEDFTLPPLPTTPQPTITVAPRTQMSSEKCRITMEQAQIIYRRERRLFLFAQAKYRDVFPDTRPHETIICAEIFIDYDPSFAGNQFRMIPHGTHNRTS